VYTTCLDNSNCPPAESVIQPVKAVRFSWRNQQNRIGTRNYSQTNDLIVEHYGTNSGSTINTFTAGGGATIWMTLIPVLKQLRLKINYLKMWIIHQLQLLPPPSDYKISQLPLELAYFPGSGWITQRVSLTKP